MVKKKNLNYSKGCVYLLTDGKHKYVGSTCNFEKRKRDHKALATNSKQISNVHRCIRENGGWNAWTIIKLGDYICNNREELVKIEQRHIDRYSRPWSSCIIVNKNRASKTSSDSS